MLTKKEAEGEVENVGIVFEIKSTRFLNKAFVIDSHGLALVDNQYDVLLVFTLLPSRGSTKTASRNPKNMALHQVGEAMITPTIRGPAAGTAGASAAAADGGGGTYDSDCDGETETDFNW